MHTKRKRLTLRDHFGQAEKVELLWRHGFGDIHVDMIVDTFRLDGQAGGGGQLVDEHVTAQVAVAPELLATLATVERLDVGVRQQVRLQVRALVEAAAANVTLVR